MVGKETDKYEITVEYNKGDKNSRDVETYDYSTGRYKGYSDEEIKKHFKDMINTFNKGLRPHEKARKLISVKRVILVEKLKTI